MNTYLVYLKDAYVRDAQGYLFGKVEEMDEVEDGWNDVFGPLLLMTLNVASDKDVWEKIHRWYPEADPEVFTVEKVCGGIESVEKPENGWINAKKEEKGCH